MNNKLPHYLQKFKFTQQLLVDKMTVDDYFYRSKIPSNEFMFAKPTEYLINSLIIKHEVFSIEFECFGLFVTLDRCYIGSWHALSWNVIPIVN